MTQVAFTPKNLLLSITQECNLRCGHCSVQAGQPYKSELSVDEIKDAVLRPCHELGMEEVVVSGGEPLLREEECLEIMRFCAKTLGIRTILSTTATTVTEGLADEIADIGIDCVTTPLYAAEKEFHELVTQVDGSYEATLTGISNLLEAGVETQVIMVPMSQTANNQVEILPLVKSLGVKDVMVFRLAPAGRAREQWETISLSPTQVRQLNTQLRQTAQDIGIACWAAGFASKQEFSRLVDVDEEQIICGSLEGCGAGRHKLYINACGEVFPCGALESYFTKAGNVREKGIDAIWAKAAVFQLMRYFHGHYPFPCSECQHLALCEADCRAQTLGLYDDLTIPNPECPRVKKLSSLQPQSELQM